MEKKTEGSGRTGPWRETESGWGAGMMEWVRFWLTAAVLATALIGFGCAVLGAWRFGFILNRLHAAGIGDTFGIMFVVLSLLIAPGHLMDDLKMVLLVFFMWFSSPVSTHFLGQVEYYTNPDLTKHVEIQAEEEEAADESD